MCGPEGKPVSVRASGPLDGVRVLELATMVAGPMCTQVLADQGADVVKIEPPGGDLLRAIGCSRAGVSAVFASINRGKRSVVLDLTRARGRDVLARLAARCDVVVDNFRPGVAARLGAAPEDLATNPRGTVSLSIRGFGSDGPYAGRRVYDAVIQALSGMAAAQGHGTGRGPELVRTIVCDKVTALYGAQAIAAALFARERGRGSQHIELSMLDAAVAFLWPDVMQEHTYLGDGVTRPAPLHAILSAHPTRDGHVAVMAISDAEFEGLARVLGRPELTGDARFATVATRMEHSEELAAIVVAHAAEQDTAPLVERLLDEGVPAAPVNEPADVHADPQVVANRTLADVDDADLGRVRVARAAARFDQVVPEPGARVPALGADTGAVLGELGIEEHERAALGEDGALG